MRHGLPPDWLLLPALAVLDDLQGADPIEGLQIVASTMDDHFNGLSLGLVERSSVNEPLAQLPDDLDPRLGTSYGGGNWVPRSIRAPELLVLVAELLQEDLAETVAGWGQARPPCPRHPHPTHAVVRGNEAWWICPRDDDQLYRIGHREVPTQLRPAPTWHPTESRRARKRRHH